MDAVATALPAEKLPELLTLLEGADSVELKATIPVTDRQHGAASLGVDPLDAQIRQVYFFDTPDLALNKNGLVLRARRVQRKGDDSVVKLRPVVPAELPEDLRASPTFGVEVDALPGGFVCSGTLKRALGTKTSGGPSSASAPCASSSRRSSAPSTPSTRRRESRSTTSRSSGRSSS
jgi:hypothetical protein